MKFRLEFDMDNDAFQDALGNWEIVAILARLSNQIQADIRTHISQGWSQFVRDSNGNGVGYAIVEEEIDVNDPPAWVLGQDPSRCEGCGSQLDSPSCPVCDREGVVI